MVERTEQSHRPAVYKSETQFEGWVGWGWWGDEALMRNEFDKSYTYSQHTPKSSDIESLHKAVDVHLSLACLYRVKIYLALTRSRGANCDSRSFRLYRTVSVRFNVFSRIFH